MNPLIPAISDDLWAIAITVNLALMVAALVSLANSADKRHWTSLLLIIVFAPIMGPVISLIVTHQRRHAIAEIHR